jgi:cytochrome c oxidase assembly factor CtaG
MNPTPPTFTALLTTWTLPVLPFVTILLTAAVYLRGWLTARTRPQELPPWRALCFCAGLLTLWLAIASPLDAFDDYLLTAHMIQHFLLMSVIPPLLVLGAPQVPLLRGLPRWLIRRPLHPLFASRPLHRLARFVLHPATVWLAMNAAYLGWHVPAAFELTFRSETIHQSEHLCFLLTSIAFWAVILEPWPYRCPWPRWAIIPYLLGADLLNTVLSAILVFSGRVLYPSYAAAPRICRLTPLQDQIAAGSEMWVLNSLVYLIPAIALIVAQLSPRALRAFTVPR